MTNQNSLHIPSAGEASDLAVDREAAMALASMSSGPRMLAGLEQDDDLVGNELRKWFAETFEVDTTMSKHPYWHTPTDCVRVMLTDHPKLGVVMRSGQVGQRNLVNELVPMVECQLVDESAVNISCMNVFGNLVNGKSTDVVTGKELKVRCLRHVRPRNVHAVEPDMHEKYARIFHFNWQDAFPRAVAPAGGCVTNQQKRVALLKVWSQRRGANKRNFNKVEGG